ncbi:hypothetical protein CYMTET_55359 [Cymbomonas tetramitiformis]|uniref:Uncharacterized protein n=1 Tax=Cymbomonas tetramitiformis TaxID=36881 RepID=A0AAE0BF10_9CHLO|nr:hypothetical protein CYMTET_55359 [Cymbomonas tetramitiformis]
MVQHATGAVHLRCGEGPMPGLHLSLPQPTELPAPEYREMFLEDDGRVMTKGPKTYSQSGFIYRLIQFVRTMPSTYVREIHFYTTHVEWQLFFQLRKDWPRDSIWRQYTDDWQLQRRMFQDLDERPGVGPFSIDAGCDESGSNAQTTSFCTVVQDCLLQDWSGHNAWCNPPFSKILLILWHFLGCKRRQNVGISACFVIIVWPTADFYKFIGARPSVFRPLVRSEAETDFFTAPFVGICRS